uniref:DUF38 domain-containing protein n=1 Tax=Panagrolaimus superbus TaxID=310955 RepID=A0A914YE31_9BILA
MLVASRLSISAEHCQVFFGNEIITFPPAATKFWVIDGFALSPNAFSSPISKIYHCTATELCIQEQILSFNEFCFISSNTNDIHFAKVTVKNDDGSIVAFEKLVETLPKVKAIFYRADSAFPSFTKETIHELVKIPHFFKIIKLHIFDVSEAFDLEAFYNFIKSNKFTNIQISFNESISERYKKRIGEIIDEIIATEGSFTYKPPHITFVGNDPDRWNKLRSISAKFLGHSF